MIADRCIFRCLSRGSLCVATGKPSFSQSIWPRASRTSVYSTWGILCRLSFVDHADKWKILHTQHMFFSVADGCIRSTPRNQYSLLSGVCARKYRSPYIQCSRASAAGGHIVHFHHIVYTYISSCCANKKSWASSACNCLSVDHVHILQEYISF